MSHLAKSESVGIISTGVDPAAFQAGEDETIPVLSASSL